MRSSEAMKNLPALEEHIEATASFAGSILESSGSKRFERCAGMGRASARLLYQTQLPRHAMPSSNCVRDSRLLSSLFAELEPLAGKDITKAWLDEADPPSVCTQLKFRVACWV